MEKVAIKDSVAFRILDVALGICHLLVFSFARYFVF